jgi:hypothetical protein
MLASTVRKAEVAKSGVGYEILLAVVVKISVTWDITPCSLLKISRMSACCLRYAVFLLEEGVDMFL